MIYIIPLFRISSKPCQAAVRIKIAPPILIPTEEDYAERPHCVGLFRLLFSKKIAPDRWRRQGRGGWNPYPLYVLASDYESRWICFNPTTSMSRRPGQRGSTRSWRYQPFDRNSKMLMFYTVTGGNPMRATSINCMLLILLVIMLCKMFVSMYMKSNSLKTKKLRIMICMDQMYKCIQTYP